MPGLSPAALAARIGYQLSIRSAAVVDLPRIVRARARDAVAFFDPVWPAWPKGFHGEYEYTELARRIPERVYVFGSSPRTFNFYQSIGDASRQNAELAAISFPTYAAGTILKFRRAYSIFSSTLHAALPMIRKSRAKFGWTAYPGCTLLDDPQSDARIEALLDQPGFVGVIATQPVVRDYLLSRFGLSPDRVKYSFGGLFRLPDRADRFERFEEDLMNVVFCAHRFMPWGKNKGLDLFVDAMAIVRRATRRVRPIIVGPFDEEMPEIRSRLGPDLIWHRDLHNKALLELFSRSHVLFAFTRPHFWRPGNFDGFPLATAVQAAASGMLTLMNDPLAQGKGAFEAGEHYLELADDPGQCAEMVLEVLGNRDLTARVARAGHDAAHALFGIDRQMDTRLALLKAMQE